MDPFHERLARTGLGATERYGFALAGGYAVQAAGLLEPPLCFAGVPNQRESPSRNVASAVAVGSSSVAAQATCHDAPVGAQGEVGCEGAGQGVVAGTGPSGSGRRHGRRVLPSGVRPRRPGAERKGSRFVAAPPRRITFTETAPQRPTPARVTLAS
ncbi:hypothetical protein Vse01_16000 [Micromonospora sediminimaris]|uniref:Uncharacterized protein n=1 Tax=Micromonospora sediminimaris TaxID=547162 RepID=A0A9W5UN23_9ACTN|nr:hypothetical protein Vse01_16000 [Micromonospora sediminimaris]